MYSSPYFIFIYPKYLIAYSSVLPVKMLAKLFVIKSLVVPVKSGLEIGILATLFVLGGLL